MVASVSSSITGTDTAFKRAICTTLVGAMIARAALLAGEDDDVVVDGVGEADLGLRSSRRENQIFGPAADAQRAHMRPEPAVLNITGVIRSSLHLAGAEPGSEGGGRKVLSAAHPTAEYVA